MAEEMNIVCDECGATEKKPKHERTPKGWLRLEYAKILYRKKAATKRNANIPDKNRLNVSSCDDPDFCSKECFDAWMDKEVTKIMKA